MKILQICAYSADYSGNFINSLTYLEQKMNEYGHTTEYLFPHGAKDKQWCIEIQKRTKVYFANTNRFSISTYKEVKSAMKNADVVHSHFELYDCLVFLARKKNQKIFWHLHDSFDDNIDFIHNVINIIQYKYLSKNVTLISPSKYYGDYVKKLGFCGERIRIVENCIDLSRFNHTSPKLKKFDFLVFGGFYIIKGLDILLDACRLLNDNGYVYKLGLIGYKATWDFVDKFYPDLSNNIIRLEPNENVESFYNMTKVFLSTSRRESFSYALLEAIYLGLPAIISDIPGTSWAKKYKSVTAFTSEDAFELYQKLSDFLNNNMWYSQEDLTLTSEDVKLNYNINNWTKRIGELYLNE